MQALVDAPYIFSLQPPLLHNGISVHLPSTSECKDWVFWQGSCTINTQQSPIRFPQPDSISIWLHIHVLISAIIFSTPQLTESQENVSLLKTPRQWNQWDGDESLQSTIPPALGWKKVFGLQRRGGSVAGKRVRFALGFLYLCVHFFLKISAWQKEEHTADEPKEGK